jgi:hypothetical protein
MIMEYVTIRGIANALLRTTATEVSVILSCLPLTTSARAMNAVQPMVKVKTKPKYQGKNFRPTLQMDSRSGGLLSIMIPRP